MAAAPDNGPAGLFDNMDAPVDPRDLERLLCERGRIPAGVDEVGRGPLAGPVVAAAVILDPHLEYPGVGDSKALKPEVRERLFGAILRRARAVGLGMASPAEIDRDNILAASLTAMARAVDGLPLGPDYLLVDGISKIPLTMDQQCVRQGDARHCCIGAASIVAKVVRDRIMAAYDRRFPGYGFAGHKGYGSKEHLEAIDRLGPCPIHRMSFRPFRS